MLRRSAVTSGNIVGAMGSGAEGEGGEERIARRAGRETRRAFRPPLDGNEVMEHLRLPPGPLVGEALAYLMELRLERGPIEREEALQLLDEWARDRGIGT